MRMKTFGAVAAALVVAGGALFAIPAQANQGGYGEGCTPGFWKNHLDWKSYDDNSNPTNDDFLPVPTSRMHSVSTCLPATAPPRSTSRP